jgi:hypothetical protein
MARVAAEVLIGTGTLYIAVDGTAQPLDPTVAPAAAYVEVGYSEEGWSFNADIETEDIEVAEEIDPIDIMATGREAHLVGQAAQASLENLKTALGGGTITTVVGPPAYKQYEAPASGDLTRVTLLFRGKAPPVAGVAKTRELWVPHAVPIAAVEMASKKAPDKSLIGMDFRAIKVSPDTLFRYRDLT